MGEIVTNGLAAAGFDAYGNPQGDWYDKFDIPSDWPEYTTNTGRFLIHPFYEDDESDKPNICDTEAGICLWWYKCCPREISANKDITIHELRMAMLRLKDDANKVHAIPYDADKELQEDLKIWHAEKELDTNLSLHGNFDIPENLKNTLSEKIKRYGHLRKAKTLAELAWAIRLAPQARDGQLTIELHTTGPEAQRKIVKTTVEVKEEKVMVKRAMLKTPNQPQGYSIIFRGSVEDFNKTSWALLLMAQLGHDIPTLENLGETMPDVNINEHQTNIDGIVMCDISRPENLSLRPRHVSGTTRMNLEFRPDDGEMTITIDAGTTKETSAVFYMDDIRKAILLANMAKYDEFNIWIHQDDNYARIELADTTIGTDMTACWNRIAEEQKGTKS